MEQEYLIVSFKSSHDAMKAETICGKQKLPVRLIPVPPEVSAGCGLALRSEMTDEREIRRLLSQEAITGAFYRLIRNGIRRTVERME